MDDRRLAFAEASDFVPIHYIGTTPDKTADPHQKNVREGRSLPTICRGRQAEGGHAILENRRREEENAARCFT